MPRDGSPSSLARWGAYPTQRQCAVTVQIILFVMHGTARADNQN